MDEDDHVAVAVNVETTDAISATGTDISKESEPQKEAEEIAVKSCETIPAIHSYQIKPTLADKFKAGTVKDIIRCSLGEKLNGKVYDPEQVKKWTMELANEISSKVTELKMKRYKHVVQVIIGEHKGAGVKSGVRCIWDSETDGYTSDIFSNDTLFCLAVVYAIYLY